jgi:hypothetical protein
MANTTGKEVRRGHKGVFNKSNAAAKENKRIKQPIG